MVLNLLSYVDPLEKEKSFLATTSRIIIFHDIAIFLLDQATASTAAMTYNSFRQLLGPAGHQFI
jgi:hypothetical protein